MDEPAGSNNQIDPDDLMDIDEGDASDLDEEEEELIDDPVDPTPSPFHLPSSDTASAATSNNSSPPNNDDVQTPFTFTGKPLSVKRGRGRPRREGGKPLVNKKSNLGVKFKKWRPLGQFRGISRKAKNLDRVDFDFSSVTPPSEETYLDPETGSFVVSDKDKFVFNEDLSYYSDKTNKFQFPEDSPYPPEQWPGKVCALCNLGERSQLGQGELLRLTCPEGFIPRKIVSEITEVQPFTSRTPEREPGDKSPRGGPVTCRRQKGFSKSRHQSLTNEYVDELSIIGYIEEPDVHSIFEVTGHFYVHRNCAAWSDGVLVHENSALENVGLIILRSLSIKCSFCNHYGASLNCKYEDCCKMYHYPCATASGAFQELKTFTVFCLLHLGQVTLLCESSVCYTCKALGDIANLMFCSSCGEHYHGTCVGLAQLPGVRAGWQCRKCKICQVCRMIGDESKLMACEQCDKVYHSMCQRPVVTSIPKYGWKCKCCRICGDCGSRTPGAGLSSRWHAHYTVCDSCYQQRNKGFSCPLCHRAYRAHAYREMAQCALCRRFVHGNCDPDADITVYQQKKEIHPDYEYICPNCKNITQQGRQLMVKRNSIDESIADSQSASQDSLYDEPSPYDFDPEKQALEDRSIGLGKGKPYSASKIAKKRLGLGNSLPGRPKGIGKTLPGKVGFTKKQRLNDFGRKRGPKTKMRGIFGVPGVGLQRPTGDGTKNDEEPGVENRLVLCSAKDKFVLTQDICVMCGALGTDQEGCLIACIQCGQCYHPYCVNVKVTKVVLQKGWRCLDCTVCEGCGQRNDEARLILCDECDISYHIYCMDPPLDYVPHGNWKCKWCAICQTCGANDPGFNCSWMNSYTECGPCSSHNNCPSCMEAYNEGDLIIQCVQCERWLHATCDSIKTEAEAEKCAEEGYNCILCRPRDVPPPHLQPQPTPKPPTPTKSPEMKSSQHYYVDGVYLSEAGHNLIKAMTLEQHITRKKRKKLLPVQDKEAGIMATIESVVAGTNSIDNSLEESAKLELVEVKEEPQDIYKEGMIWSKEDGPPPDGFTLFTMESGVTVLRRKRQRNLQKLGIGGFLVRMRGIRGTQDNDDVDMLPGQSTPMNVEPSTHQPLTDGEKPRRKPTRRKPKSKLAESFPPYLQEAFFGRELLEANKELDSSSGSDEEGYKYQNEKEKTIQLSQDEIKAVAAVTAKQEKYENSKESAKIFSGITTTNNKSGSETGVVLKEEDESDSEALKDVLNLPGDLLDTDLVNTIMNEDDDELSKNADNLEKLADSNLPEEPDMNDSLSNSNNSKDTKDELTDILGSHFNIESIPNINSKDVEDIFKGVLTDESQESEESNTAYPKTSVSTNSSFNNVTGNSDCSNTSSCNNSNPPQAVLPQVVAAAPVRPTTLPNVNQSNLNSPISFPPQSPYHSEYSNSPQFSPAFSEPRSPWVSITENNEAEGTTAVVPSTYNQRSSEKMKADEGLGSGATISAVLYANMNHPEWKTEYPSWNDRYKQIIKKWRTLSTEQRAPYLQQARDNRSALRMKKQQQMSKEGASSSPAVPKTATPASITLPTQVTIVSAISEVCNTTHEAKPTSSLLTNVSASSGTMSPPAPPRPMSLPSSATTHRQFTVHKHYVGLTDRSGPAPNVTVNPLYQPNVEHGSPLIRPLIAHPSAADQQIRVLTPSEIMRTLPSLSQETYENQLLDKEKFVQQQKNAKEAEQERQWKQLQALRHQQAQQQQHILHEQRSQAMVNVQRHVTEGSSSFSPEQRQQFKKLDEQLLPGKGQQRVWPPQEPTTTLEQQQQQQSQQQQQDQNTLNQSSVDVTFRHPLPPAIARPRGVVTSSGILLRQPGAIVGVRIPGNDPKTQGLEPRMRLLLQQRTLMQTNLQQPQQQQKQVPQTTQQPQQQQQQQQQHLQHQQSSTSNFQQQISRPAHQTLERSHSLEQFDPLIRKQSPNTQQPKSPESAPVTMNASSYINARSQQQQQQQQSQQLPLPSTSTPAINQSAQNDQELPDNVTAELEKLEQETGSMVELQGVSDILGGLGDDDDELLAEMGADFNILEYADPELDSLTTGEKTNILDSLDLVDSEHDKEEKKDKTSNVQKQSQEQPPSSVIPVSQNVEKAESIPKDIVNTNLSSNTNPSVQPSTVVVARNVPTPQSSAFQMQLTAQQQVHQQMLHQVQQAATSGRPMAPGTKLMSPEGVIGVVTPNNNVSLTFPSNYAQRLQMQLQNQKLHMRLVGTTASASSRLTSPAVQNSGLSGLTSPSRINSTPPKPPPPPPPPPYPGPPPPYPGSTNQQMGYRMGSVPPGPLSHLSQGYMYPTPLQAGPLLPHLQRKPVLLQEQPLLLEELLEQEKREQEKQQLQSQNQETSPSISTSRNALLSDHDFERLKADVFSNGGIRLPSGTQSGIPAQGLLPVQSSSQISYGSQQTQQQNSQWQQSPSRPSPIPTPQPPAEITSRVPIFNATLLPAPPLPPENIVSEQDRQTQIVYEQWLNNQNTILSQQLKFYETEVQKLRKARKSLNSKQRQLRKSGNQLTEIDAKELQRISAEQTILQKHLESSRKQSRQHGMLIQEYRNKQQVKQRPSPGQSPLLSGNQQTHSPLGPPASSPVHSSTASQSPMMSPSASPMTSQHNSPLQSPRPLVSHSPGPSSVTSIIQSPGNTANSMSPIQPSPRIGTPHSQSEGSPGPVQSPSQVCFPPPAPRMTSPQHRRMVTSPVGYIPNEIRGVSQQSRFIRTGLNEQHQRARLTSPSPGFPQRVGTPSPLNSPPPQQIQLTQQQQQQILQRHLQQQAFLQQQQQQPNQQQQNQNAEGQQSELNILHSQRAMQLIQQRQIILRQQQQQQQFAQQQQQQTINQIQSLTPQQHQLLLQQQHQLVKQQQQQQQLVQLQNQSNRIQTQPPSSPIPPQSPMLNQGQQIMSPHSVQPASPMPPRSPMVGHSNNQPPSSPISRSPVIHQNISQPPSSPMLHPQQQPVSSPLSRSPSVASIQSPLMRRPPSNSPAIPDRPLSVENPSTPRTPYTPESDHTGGGNPFNPLNPMPTPPDCESSGGGNPHNPLNPIPTPPLFGKFGYIKLGLRGGSPMWGFGRGTKRIPNNMESKEDKAELSNETSASAIPPRIKRESHLSKVSILKKKSPAKTNLQSFAISKVASLVSSDYNDFEDSSSPPVTPPPNTSTNRSTIHSRAISGKKVPVEHAEHKEQNQRSLMVMNTNPSPGGKRIPCEDMIDYDDDNGVVSTEVSLSSAAQQNDGDDITVIETFSQSDINEVISSPLESEQIGDEFLLFPGNVVDIAGEAQYSDKEEEEGEYGEEIVDISDKNMQIVNVAIQSPTTSEEEMIIQGKTKKVTTGGYIVQGISSNQLLTVSEAPDSPDQEDVTHEGSPEHYSQSADEELISNLEESEIVIIDPSIKSPEEQISTKEDFEELIDEGSRKEKLFKQEVINNKHITEIHRYAVNTAHQKSSSTASTSVQNSVVLTNISQAHPTSYVVTTQEGNRVKLTNSNTSDNTTILTVTSINNNSKSLANSNSSPASIFTKSATNVVIASQPSKLTNVNTISSGITNIILPIKTSISRSNIISVPKLITSASPLTIVSGNASVLSSRFTIPVISASDLSKLPNVRVIDKPSSSISLSTQDTLPKKIFEDGSISPDSSTNENEKSKRDVLEKPGDQKPKQENRNEKEDEKQEKVNGKQFFKKYFSDTPDITRKIETIQLSNVFADEGIQRLPSPIIARRSSPVIVHSAPELKMTARVIQEKPTNVHIANRIGETISASFITAQSSECPNDADADKSVVISIPSPTPSQEQMLDNIALQELENRRRDGKSISEEFDSFEDVLDMITNITGETPTILEGSVKKSPPCSSSFVISECEKKKEKTKLLPQTANQNNPSITESENSKATESITLVTSSSKSTVMPQLSPLSQPMELTTNMANVSQQLRTLLSSLHTTSITSTTNVTTAIKNAELKENMTTNSKESVISTSGHNSKSLTRTSPPFIQSEHTSIFTSISGIIQKKNDHVGSTFSSNSSSKSTSIQNHLSTSVQNHLSTSIQNHLSTSSSPNTVSESSQSISTATSTVISNLMSNHLVTSIQQAPTDSKLPPITAVASSNVSSSVHVITQTPVLRPSSVITTADENNTPQTTSPSQSNQRVSLSLNAMLQSHPAATIAQTAPSTITTASILGTPISISRSSFSPSLVHAQPHVVSPAVTNTLQQSQSSAVSSNENTIQNASIAHNSDSLKTVSSSGTLLHSQLTRSHYVKHHSTSEEDSNINDVKKDDMTMQRSTITTSSSPSVPSNNMKFSQIPNSVKIEDSQNVLLKQLLQNTGCVTTQSTVTSSPSTTVTAPSLPIVPSLEAQLARPVPPTPTSLLPPFLQNDTNTSVSQSSTKTSVRSTIVSRETSFVSKPLQPQQPLQQLPTTVSSSATTQLHIDVKKCVPVSRTPSRDELLSPPTPRSTCSQDSSLHTPPLVIKKEPSCTSAQQSPVLTQQEVKKELVDESSQHSEISDQSRSDIQMKEEMESLDLIERTTTLEQKEEMKKLKRRAYQQKRRQNQLLNKEAASGQPKKRPRKSSKIEEDYDSYIDGVLVQLRTLPTMVVQEPVLGKNFTIVPIFGSGDLSKLGSKNCDSRVGELNGSYGNATVPGYSDYYNTKPYGPLDPLPEKSTPSTQRGFYDQEFPLIKFDADEDRKFELFCRDNDTPDSIISSSSPETTLQEPYSKFFGLKLIDEDEEQDEEEEEEQKAKKQRLSPVIPLVMPIPIKLKPIGPYLKDYADVDKENIGKEYLGVKTKFNPIPPTPLRDSGNVTVTLTLTSSAAEDIMGVLRDLANILHIPPPTSYQIVERTSTPPSQKLGLYRTKGKDGKEGAPIDIQSILNGAAKFCRHCDVVILNSMIRKKVSELPFLTKDSELLGDGDELYFCSSTCYMQFAIMHRSPSLSEDKAAAIVDHLSHRDKLDVQNRKGHYEKDEFYFDKKPDLEKVDSYLSSYKASTVDFDVDIKPDINFLSRNFDFDQNSRKISHDILPQRQNKTWKDLRYRYWTCGVLQPRIKHKKPTDKEIMELLFRLGITVRSQKVLEDSRKCMFCHGIGDGVSDGPARLLNFDVDKWVHLNCGLWSDGVYETVNGALMNLENALQQSLVTVCVLCNKLGATIRCFKTRCLNVYHLTCAVKDNCVFYKNKTMYCISHYPKNEKDNELTTLSVWRRVYVNRDENRQVAAVMQHASDTNNLLRVGSLIFLSVGQLLPHQLQNFHSANFIYPIGYKIVRFYWSIHHLNKRCRYVCSIQDVSGRPEFRVLIQDPPEEDIEFRDSSPKGAWTPILEKIAQLRRDNQCLQMFPKFLTGEDLFGLTEPAVVRVLESLPGIETLTDYKFKYGRNPLLELPLAINPSGAARTEPKLRNHFHWKRQHTQRTGSSVRPVFVPTVQGMNEAVCPYSKQFVHSKSSQYKKMKQEWRNNVYLARSKIQGLGLYAARDLEKHTMVIEYIGEIIRTELAETREKKYEAKNRGIYMFRLDEERVIDATLCGGLARYINHSCNPNCVAEIVEVDRDLRIIIFAKRRIQRGEELAYDYKFDIEDDQHKISCMCGAPNCRKWMN